jgi:hypothetical protein
MKPTSRRNRLPVPSKFRKQWLRLERLEDRVQPAVFYSADGSGNNTGVGHSSWGQAGADLIRLSPVAYADGISSPALPNAKSARDVSNIVSNQADPANPSEDLSTYDGRSLTDFNYTFGQFVDHDLDLTPDGGTEFDIPVAANDPIGPNNLAFTRSQYDPTTGTSTLNPRQQVTDVTSYLDLSQVYGSDAATADALRSHIGGQLKTSPGNMLPYFNSTYFTAAQLAAINAAVGGMANSGPLPSSSLFATGDTRGNENIELTVLQTLYMRNHNRIAAQLQATHPTWTDDQLYQEARALNIAGYQAVIYNEWLPPVLGPQGLRPYQGYNPNVNASIATEFSTVGFRFGHSLVDNEIERHTNNGTDINIVGGADIPLAYDFFYPTLLSATSTTDPFTGLTSTGLDPVLKANADGVSQAMDTMAVGSIRNLLFGNAGDGGEDLIARDIQRGRDHGVADYNTMRAAYGLPRVTSFAQITANTQVQQELQQAYGDVNHIDAFEGGSAEDHIPGSDFGPLFQAIIVDQFARLRDGDRLFFMNQQWTPEEQNIINQNNSLSKVISANTGINNLQPNVFVFSAGIAGTVFVDGNRDGVRQGNEPGQPNVSVRLLNALTNEVIATTTTDPQGNYRFAGVNGLTTGQFLVQEVTPTGWLRTSTLPPAQVITRGDVNLNGVNFGNALPQATFINLGPIVPVSDDSPLPPPSAHGQSAPPPANLPPVATAIVGTSASVGGGSASSSAASASLVASAAADASGVDLVEME